MTNPTNAAKTAIDRGIGQVSRRIEVYESDGETLWNNGLSDRLSEGGVNLQYGDNERRTLDLSLNNEDNFLRSNPYGFWYDKVIKVFRGVTYRGSDVALKGAVIEAPGGSVSSGVSFAALMKRFGIDATYVTGYSSAADLMDYDIIISFTGSTSASAQATVLKQFYDSGRAVITVSTRNSSTQVPHLGATSTVQDDWGISQPSVPTELSTGWSSEGVSGTVTGTVATAVSSGAVIVARWLMNNAAYAVTGSVAFNNVGGKWFDLHLPSLQGLSGSTHIYALFQNAVNWIRSGSASGSAMVTWETQIGEFVIDSINGASYPSLLKVTGRDYVKKCMNSKVTNTVSFAAGTRIDTLITALAANAGITKMRLATMPEALVTALVFDRGTPRWEIMRNAAVAFNYEIYFDAEGYLTTRKFNDPTLGEINHEFSTGPGGNLASLDRNTHDSRIYNHVVVFGDPPSGEQRLPYVGEAMNTNPDSPTHIARIGDRYYSYASTFFTTQQQCQDYADRLLKLHALESFELSFTAINYPWIEVGNIARITDPDAVVTDPDRYLVDTATIPLSLGPMTMTGKRVTLVGSWSV